MASRRKSKQAESAPTTAMARILSLADDHNEVLQLIYDILYDEDRAAVLALTAVNRRLRRFVVANLVKEFEDVELADDRISMSKGSFSTECQRRRPPKKGQYIVVRPLVLELATYPCNELQLWDVDTYRDIAGMKQPGNGKSEFQMGVCGDPRRAVNEAENNLACIILMLEDFDHETMLCHFKPICQFYPDVRC